jgi:hypothetical protein
MQEACLKQFQHPFFRAKDFVIGQYWTNIKGKQPTIFQLQHYTDQFYHLVELTQAWSGRYTVLCSKHAAPNIADKKLRRDWWNQQLKFNAIDPFNYKKLIFISPSLAAISASHIKRYLPIHLQILILKSNRYLWSDSCYCQILNASNTSSIVPQQLLGLARIPLMSLSSGSFSRHLSTVTQTLHDALNSDTTFLWRS